MCLQDPCLQLIPQVRAARSYESLSTHEALTTINAFGARVKWLFYPPGKRYTTPHRWLRTLAKRSQHFNATYRKWIEFNIERNQRQKANVYSPFREKVFVAFDEWNNLDFSRHFEKYSIISFLHTVHISFSYTCQYISEPPTSDKIDISL